MRPNACDDLVPFAGLRLYMSSTTPPGRKAGRRCFWTLDYMSSIQSWEVVFDYMEPPEAFSEGLRQLEKERAEQLKKMDERSVSRFEPGWHGSDASLARIL